MLKLTIYLLRLANILHFYWFKFAERWQKIPPWAAELGRYFQTSPQNIVKAYYAKQPQANSLWDKKPRLSLKSIFSFYSETDYFVYRQNYFNRLNSWWDVAWPMLAKPAGSLCEYGAGIGPVTNWLIQKFPQWQYRLVDLNCPAFKFGRWRFKNKTNVGFSTVKSLKPPLKENFDIIVCRYVMEHVPNPLLLAKAFTEHLKPGGWLFIDFIDSPGGENLEKSYQERKKVLKYLKTKLKPIFTIYSDGKDAGYGLYLK